MLLQFSLDESCLLASAPGLFVRALCCLLVVAFPFLAVRAVLIMLELDGKSSNLEAGKKSKCIHLVSGKAEAQLLLLKRTTGCFSAETLLFGITVVMTCSLSRM